MAHIGQAAKLGFQVASLLPGGKPKSYVNPLTGETLSARKYRNRTEAESAGYASISEKQREQRQLDFTYVGDFQSVIGNEKEVWRVYKGETIEKAYKFAQESGVSGDVIVIVAFCVYKGGKKKRSGSGKPQWVTVQNAQTQRLYQKMSDSQIDAIASEYTNVSEVNVWKLAI